MPKQLVKIKRFYNFFAPTYDWLLYPFFIFGWKYVAKKINNNKYKSVIELACNDAPVLNYIEVKTNYTGVDIADKTIKKAIKEHHKFNNATFTVANAENLPLNIMSLKYDCALLLYVLSVTPNPLQLLKSAYDSLKPGGELMVINHFSSLRIYRLFDKILNFFSFSGVNFYHPFPTNNQLKGFNIVSQKRILLFWTFLHLKKI